MAGSRDQPVVSRRSLMPFLVLMKLVLSHSCLASDHSQSSERISVVISWTISDFQRSAFDNKYCLAPYKHSVSLQCQMPRQSLTPPTPLYLQTTPPTLLLATVGTDANYLCCRR